MNDRVSLVLGSMRDAGVTALSEEGTSEEWHPGAHPDFFRRLADAAADGIVVHLHGRIEYANPAFHRLLGARNGAGLIHRDLREFAAGEQPALAALLEAAGGAGLDGDRARACEFQLRGLDGRIVHAEISGGAVLPASPYDAALGFLLVRDITPREARYRDESFNEARELAALFCHDLKAPARAIHGFASMLQEELARLAVPDAAVSDLRQVLEASSRLGSMIDGMLSLTRLKDPAENGQKSLNTNHLVAKILEELDVPGHVVVRRAALYPLYGDPTLLRQAIQNLISNAIKFSRDRAQPVIEIQCGKEGGEVVFSAADNGVGFDEKQQDLLFTPFRRLDTSHGFEGVGAGLSIVRRIVDYHGGRVWAEGRQGKGATFYFSLPLPSV